MAAQENIEAYSNISEDIYGSKESEGNYSFRVHAILLGSQPGNTEDTLRSLKNQSHKNLKITLVDLSGMLETSLSGSLLEDVRLVKGGSSYNYSQAANIALADDSKADFFLFLTDVAVPEPDLVRTLAGFAISANVSVAGPKLMSHRVPQEIVGMGLGVDKTGAIITRVSPGELDQKQYDAAQSVFAVQGDCMLMRADLFRALGGFDEKMAQSGQDLDICWRALVAGARISIEPRAVAFLRVKRFEKNQGRDQLSKLSYRCQIRMLLTSYGFMHTIRVLPQALGIAFIEVFWGLISARPQRAAYILGGWLWNLFRPFSILKKRRATQKLRRKPDKDIRKFQERGFAFFTLFARDRDSPFADIQEFVKEKKYWLAWIGFLTFLLIGSRHLLTRSVPVVGEFLPLNEASLQEWFATWRSNGLGADGAAPSAYFWLGIWQYIFFGAEAIARTVLVLLPLFLGPLGAWLLLGRISNLAKSKVIGALAYLAIPVPYNALAAGDLESLVLYATAPWILFLLISGNWSIWRNIFTLGLVMGIAAAFSSAVFILLLFLMAAFLLAGLISGVSGLGLKPLGIGAGGAVLGLALNVPWTFELWQWEFRPDTPESLGLSELSRLDAGSLNYAVVLWALPAAALGFLLLARQARGVWLTFGWVLYLGGVVVAWIGSKEVPQLGSPELLLVPAGLGLTLALGMGFEVYENDVAQRRLGWNQGLIVLAGIAFVVGVFPAAAVSLGGRWEIPKADFQGTFNSLEADNHRIVWIGHPDLLGQRSWKLDDNLAFSATQGTDITISDKWARAADDEIELLRDELLQVYKVSRLGGKLALYGVSHIILVERSAPEPLKGASISVSSDFTSRLQQQLDLRPLETRSGIQVYVNQEVLPIAADLPRGALNSANINPAHAASVFAGTSQEFLNEGDLYLSIGSNRFNLTVDGTQVRQQPIFSWASFYSHESGQAELVYETPGSYRLVLGGQILLWVLTTFGVVMLIAKNKNVRVF